MMRAPSQWEETLAIHIKATRLPVPTREYRFDDQRRWRLDFAWPQDKLAAEVDGATGPWLRGRHVRPQGYEDDCEKLNELVVRGWRCLRFTANMVESGAAIRTLERVLRPPAVKAKFPYVAMATFETPAPWPKKRS